jgi:flagellar FliJ protein
MTWSHSLIKLAAFHVEELQKRLAAIAVRRAEAEQRLDRLIAEGEAELARAQDDPAACLQLGAYLEALKLRKRAIQSQIEAARLEETGARDALAQAFEEQKKYEQVAETARLVAMKEAGRRETAALDELGLRRAASGR